MNGNIAPVDHTSAKKLLSLFKEKNLAEFSQFLQNNFFDVNQFYGYPENGTLLDLACRSKGYHEFVEILIRHGADINRINESRGTAPIHEAVEFSDLETLNILLNEDKCDVNLIDGSYHTPVLKAAFTARTDILRVLLNSDRISLEPVDGQTILHSLLHGMEDLGGMAGTTSPDNQASRYCQCLRYILYGVAPHRFDVTRTKSGITTKNS